MTCNEFKTHLASLKNPLEIPEEMLSHKTDCPGCNQYHNHAVSLMQYVENEKSLKVSPFLKTRIEVGLEASEKTGWYSRPALLTIVSVIVFIFGLVSAGLLEQPYKISATEAIAADYYFQDFPGTQLEEFWFNSDYYEE